MDSLRGWWDGCVDRLADITSSPSYAFSVYHFSSMMALWGVWLLLPFKTFEGASFDGMEALAAEFTWGLFALVLGMGKIHFLIHKRRISLSLLCLASAGLWIATSMSFLFASPPNTGAVVYLMLGLYELWLYKRLKMTP